MRPFKTVTHIIFDMDGLLLDTETIYNRIISDISKRYNRTYTQEVREKLLGTQVADTARLAVQLMDLPITNEEWLLQYKSECAVALTNPKLMPGAEKLLKHLHKNNIPFGLATSSYKQIADVKMKHHQELFNLFSHKVTGGSDPEVKSGKPSPDIFLVCASRFSDKPLPEKCLVFEDAPNGVQGAKSAGMQVVMVPDAELSMELRRDATVVLNTLEDFQPELFGLPPYED